MLTFNMHLFIKNTFLLYCTITNIYRTKAQPSSTCDPSSPDYVANAAYAPGLCGRTFYPEEELTFGSPRSLFVVPSENNGDGYYHVLGVERNRILNEGRVLWYKDSNYDGIAEESIELASAPSLNHGLVVYKGYIYASSDTTVYRWPYVIDESTNELVNVDDQKEIIVKNMNADGQGGAPGGHKTRVSVLFSH